MGKPGSTGSTMSHLNFVTTSIIRNFLPCISNSISTVALDSKNKGISVSFCTLPNVVSDTLDIFEVTDFAGAGTTATTTSASSTTTVWIIRSNSAEILFMYIDTI